MNLTRNRLFTPIIMNELPYTKYIKLNTPYSAASCSVGESLKLYTAISNRGNIVYTNLYKIRQSKGIYIYRSFYGGLLDADANFLCLVVRDDYFNKYGILVDENIAFDCDRVRILKNLVTFGVPEDHIITTTNSFFKQEFQTVLKLSVEDYDEGIQHKLSRKFIKKHNEINSYRFGHNLLHSSLQSVRN
jgi:hypothetical protein